MKAINKEMRVLLESNFDELINVVLFKCTWLNSTTNYYKCFKLFVSFCIRFLGLRSSLIPSVISNLISQSFPSIYQSSLTNSELIFASKRFSSIKELKTYLDAHLFIDDTKIERNNETLGSAIEEDLTPFNDMECSKILLTLWRKYGADYVEDNWHVFINDAKEFVASNGRISHTLLYKDYLLKLQEIMQFKFKETMDWHFDHIGIKIVDFICKLFKEFPLSTSRILNKLFEKFPYKRLPIEQQYYYFKLMLSIATRCTNIEETILSFCLDKLLLIDADTKTYWRSKLILDFNVIKERIHKSHKKIYNETEKKINVILNLLFNYFDNRVIGLVNNDIEEFANMLLKIFEERILPLYKTNYIQYAILYLLSIAEFGIFREKFISLLIIQSANRKLYKERRIVLLSYFASIIALNNFLDLTFTLEALRLFITEHSKDNIYPYFVQSLAYILCYKVDLLKNHTEIFDSIMKVVNDKEVLQLFEPNLVECLSSTVKEISAQSGKKEKTPIAIYWFFGGVNYLPVLYQKLEGKMLHLTFIQEEQAKEKTTTLKVSEKSVNKKVRELYSSQISLLLSH